VLHPPSPAGLFIYSSCGKCPFSPLQWSFLHPATFTSFPTPRFLGVCHLSCLLWPACLFTVPWGIAPPLSSALREPCLFAMCLLLLLFVIQFGFFSLFSLGGGQSVQGAVLIWPRIVCGSTMCCLAHLVTCFSQASRSWCLVAREPSWFLMEWGCYAWAGGVKESGFCLFSVVFPVRCTSSVSPRFYFGKHTFCFLPLVAILAKKF
jgi:hypothetical protein